ncbi:MAG: U32 family peptidase [Clostridia bacterium]|nr:U32 family peptidase [Clostridia bacterium]
MKKHEILAPVGAYEQLLAAVRCGADAVYLGTGNFNARRNADNFNEDSLKNAVDYCHLRNVKVYVTLNTLVFDKELQNLYETIEYIARSGADAVIVQDFAVAKAVRSICPTLPLHASTQMAVHNTSGALLLQEQGFSRVVLARELSLQEIKAIREAVSVELEVFVHGAHCMGASGNCYLSAMLGERSGNRGLCAQGCRLNWVSRNGREYALSLKDMSYLDSIDKLIEIGVESFKIEGRMKRPEYVAAAVSSLKKAVNGESYDKETLRNVFSRNGFTDGYLKEERTLEMFGHRGKDDVTSASGVLKNLSALYKDDIHPTAIQATLTLRKNESSCLDLNCKGKFVTVYGDVGEIPRNAPLSAELALRNIAKLGDTPFHMEAFTFENKDNLTLSASSINAMRREATRLLEKKLTEINRETTHISCLRIMPYHPEAALRYRARLQKISQYSHAMNEAEFIILPIEEIIENKDLAGQIKPEIIAELPQLIYPLGEEKAKAMLREIRDMGITRISTGNIGGIKLASEQGFAIHGAHGFNITNTVSLDYYESLSLADTTLSFELTEGAMQGLGGRLKRGAYIYGHLPLMLLRACPQKTEKGCDGCNGTTTLTDRKGIDFSFLCHKKTYGTLHNSVPLYIGDKNLSMLDFATLYFTTESKADCASIFEKAINRENIPGKKTNGLYTRALL